MRSLEVGTRAEEELAAAMDWYDVQQPGLSRELIEAVAQTSAGSARSLSLGPSSRASHES